MDTTSSVYVYSPLQSKEVWKPSLFYRARQSIAKSPLVTTFVLIAMMLSSFVAGGAFVYSISSSHYHDALEQTHQMDIVNASCSGESEEMKQSLLQCFHTIKAINVTVSNAGKSKAHLLQLKNGIRKEIASLQLKNESLIPHTRRRPPVDAWNT